MDVYVTFSLEDGLVGGTQTPVWIKEPRGDSLDFLPKP